MEDISAQVLTLVHTQIQERINRSLTEAAIQTPIIINKYARDMEENMEGGEIPHKIPRHNNNPDEQLVDEIAAKKRGEAEMLDITQRWEIGAINENRVIVTYKPPSWFDYLIEQPGRKWISRDGINPRAKQEIINVMKDNFK